MDTLRTFSISLHLDNDAGKAGLVSSRDLRDAVRTELARLDPALEVFCHVFAWRGYLLAVSSRRTGSGARLVIEVGLWPAGSRPVTIVRSGPAGRPPSAHTRSRR